MLLHCRAVPFSLFLLDTWIQETLQLIGAQLEGPDKMTASGDQKVPPKNTKKEVNRFFGWAIHSMTKRTRKKLNGLVKTNHDDGNAEAINQELALLLEMRVFEHQILDETTYLQIFYSVRDRLINNGWLTLVSPKYADLGHHGVISVIVGVATPVSIRENGNKWAEVVKKEASERIQSGELVETFLAVCASSKLSNSRKIRLYEQILEKTIHARMGYAYRV